MKEYIERADVQEMLENAQIISNGEYCGYCTEDVRLNSIPAADVAEVRHGRWIDLNIENSTGQIFKCSECSHIHNPNRSDLDLERVELKPLYCDACGARMDKEDEHEAG